MTTDDKIAGLQTDMNEHSELRLRPRKPFWFQVGVGLTCGLLSACAGPADTPAPEVEIETEIKSVPVQGYEVLRTFPHDEGAFTQGLLFKDGYLYESTGLRGHSTVRRVELETGKVLRAIRLDDALYGEGMAAFGDDLMVLTWKAEAGFVLNREDLSVKSVFKYEGDGWGLASSADRIFMSDGTSFIRVLNPKNLTEQSRFQVTESGVPLDKINELEWVEGELYANIWKTDKIARINPVTGEVVGWIDLTGLFKDRNPDFQGEDVLNGIAYDEASKRLFVTGKLWPQIFEISVVD